MQIAFQIFACAHLFYIKLVFLIVLHEAFLLLRVNGREEHAVGRLNIVVADILIVVISVFLLLDQLGSLS